MSSGRLSSPDEVVSSGKQVQVRLLDINPEARRMTLSLVGGAESERDRQAYEEYMKEQQASTVRLGDEFGDMLKQAKASMADSPPAQQAEPSPAEEAPAEEEPPVEAEAPEQEEAEASVPDSHPAQEAEPSPAEEAPAEEEPQPPVEAEAAVQEEATAEEAPEEASDESEAESEEPEES